MTQIGWFIWYEIEGFNRRVYEFVPNNTTAWYVDNPDKEFSEEEYLKERIKTDVGKYGRKVDKSGYRPAYIEE